MPLANAHQTAHLSITREESDGVPRLVPEGELDAWTVDSAAWQTALADTYADASGASVLLDLRRLYFLDAIGLHALEQFAAALAASGRSLRLTAVRPRVREFLSRACSELAADLPRIEPAFGAERAGR